MGTLVNNKRGASAYYSPYSQRLLQNKTRGIIMASILPSALKSASNILQSVAPRSLTSCLSAWNQTSSSRSMCSTTDEVPPPKESTEESKVSGPSEVTAAEDTSAEELEPEVA